MASSPVNPTCFIYTIGDVPASELVFVSVQHQVPPERAFVWTRILMEHISADRAVVLSSIVETTYRPIRHVSPPVIRRLDTSTCKKRNEHLVPFEDVPYLEPANVLDGLAAAILIWHEHRCLDCTVYCTVQHARCLSLEAVFPFSSVLSAYTSPRVLAPKKSHLDRIVGAHELARPSELYI
eukprot:Rmarinus@m.6887